MSRFVGIVHDAPVVLRQVSEPRLQRAIAHTSASFGADAAGLRLVPFDVRYDSPRRRPYARGASRDRAGARASAIGEALERYSAALVPFERLRWGTWRDSEVEALRPDRLNPYSDEQYGEPGFPYVPPSPDMPVRWVDAVRFVDGTRVAVPAQHAFLSRAPSVLAPVEPRLVEPVSSGLACAPTFESAALRAVLELVERDAATIAWLRGLACPRLSRDESVGGLRVECVDLSGFHRVPAVLAAAHGAVCGRPYVSYGSAAAPTFGAARRKAVAEAVLGRDWLRTRDLAALRPVDADDVETIESHTVHHFLRRSRVDGFLTAGERARAPAVEVLPGETDADRLLALVSALADSGIDVYLIDVTAPDVVSTGLRVVRALSGDLCRMNIAHRARPLGTPRLMLPVGRLNPDAQPFRAALVAEPHPFF